MTDDYYYITCPRCHGLVHPTWQYGNQSGQPCYVCNGRGEVRRRVGA